MNRIKREPRITERLCRGAMLSWDQYLPDISERGYADARIEPRGTLTQEEVDRWTT